MKSLKKTPGCSRQWYPRNLRKLVGSTLFGLSALIVQVVPAFSGVTPLQSLDAPKYEIPARFRTSSRSLILGNIDPTRTRATLGAVHADVAVSRDLGRVSSSFVIEHLQLVLRRPQERQAAFDAFVDALHRPGSDVYHDWLMPAEIGAEFGPSSTDTDALRIYLESEGLQVNFVGKSGTLIDFTGNAGQVQKSFHTEIHNIITPNGERHYSAVKNASIPEALTPIVVGFVSMSDIAPQSGFQQATSQGPPSRKHPDYTTECSGSACHFVGPQDFYTIYNERPLIAAGTNNGGGVTIALLEQSDINTDDVTHFRTTFNVIPNAAALTVKHGSGSVFCSPPGMTADEHEAVLDAEWAGTTAPGAALLFMSCKSGATAGFLLSAEAVVDDNLASIMSLSYIQAEGSQADAILASNLWEQAAAQGQTVVVCAGDTGSATNIENEHQAIASNGIAVNALASTAYNVAAGGTDFQDSYNQIQGDSAYGPALYWSPSNSAGGSSALSYVPETAWNDSCAGSLLAASENAAPSAFCAANSTYGNQGGSGGVSVLNSRPSWQNGTVYGLPEAAGSYNYRLLPDLSLFASDGAAGWGHKLIFYQSDENPAMRYGGGTSFVAPELAGVFALIQQKIGSRLGQPNYALYSLAGTAFGVSTFNGSTCNGSGTSDNTGTTSSVPSSSCIFNDIVSGNNSQECTAGSPSCYSKGGTNGVLSLSTTTEQPAYPAAPGYDLATGIGSINVSNLVNAWPMTGFKLAVSPGSLSIAAGQSATTTVTVTPVNEFTSQVMLGCSGLPPGVSCSFSSSSVTPSGAPATSQLTIMTTAQSAALPIQSDSARFPTYATLFPMLALAFDIALRWNRGRQRFRPVTLLILLFTGTVLSGCGDHKSGTPEAYLVTVSGSSSGGAAVNQTSALIITITN
jgi:pseudomonalisin